MSTSTAELKAVRLRCADTLSDILDAVRLRSFGAIRKEFTSRLDSHVPAIQMESDASLSPNSVGGGFYAIVEGACWLEVNGLAEPLPLYAGDVVVILREQGHQLRGDSAGSVQPQRDTDMDTAWACRRDGATAAFISGAFRFEDREHHRIFSALPPYIHIPAGNARITQWLEETFQFIVREIASFQPGAQSLLNQMSHILFVHAIRTYVAQLPASTGNWVAALLDPDIGMAMSHIHDRPQNRWTVASLANTVTMSRSSFAARFKQLVGQSPLRYLSDFRMTRAATLLANGRTTIKQVAADVGYNSEASFGTAFKQVYGISPGKYRDAFVAPSMEGGYRENKTAGK
jgi:AraC-like DNA-binding protein